MNSKPIILSPDQIVEKLKELPGWSYQDDKISKEFQFEDFMGSLNFINQLAPYCEEVDHHPDINLSYNKVLFKLQRFDVGGKVTDQDFSVAHKIEELYANR